MPPEKANRDSGFLTLFSPMQNSHLSEKSIMNANEKEEHAPKTTPMTHIREEIQSFHPNLVSTEVNKHHHTITDSLPQICWFADTQGHIRYVNQKGREYFQMSLEELLMEGQWLYLLHPEDWQSFLGKRRHAFSTGESYEHPYRLMRGQDNTFRWHLYRANPLKNANGEIYEWIGTCEDIQEKQDTALALQSIHQALGQFIQEGQKASFYQINQINMDFSQSSEFAQEISGVNVLLEKIISSTPIIFYIFDLITLQAIFTNSQVALLLGYTKEEFQEILPHWQEILVHPEDQNKIHYHFQQCAKFTDDESLEIKYRLKNKNGHWHWFESKDKVFKRGNNEIVQQILGTAYDITERKRQEDTLQLQATEMAVVNAHLHEMAATDHLTGLHNRRALQDFLVKEFQRAQRYNTPLSLLLIDVDSFKQFNDTDGHISGDNVLKQIGVILQDMARTSDFVVRYGGEEFIVLLPQTNQEGARAYAERCRVAVEQNNWEFRLITVSIGISTQTSEMTEHSNLIYEADRALYEAKRAGRNCIMSS